MRAARTLLGVSCVCLALGPAVAAAQPSVSAVGASAAARTARLVAIAALADHAPASSATTPDRPPSLPSPRLEWRREWRRTDWGEGLFGGAMATVAAMTYLMPPSHGDVNWRGGIALDDATWRGLALSDLGDREAIAHASDALAMVVLALPLVDALLVTWAGHGSSDVMGQMLLMDFQAHALAQGITGVVKWAVRRERPLARHCREDASRAAVDPACGAEQIEPTSFFSGHTSLAFTSAALVCLHHTELGLLGEGGSAAACASSLALAGGVGVMRMMAERHYLSDVAVGATVGLISGWLFPWLLHYAQIDGGPGSDFHAAFAPSIDPENLGLNVMGTF